MRVSVDGGERLEEDMSIRGLKQHIVFTIQHTFEQR